MTLWWRQLFFLLIFATSQAGASEFLGKIIDSSNYGYGYGYAPSIVVENNKFHMFYCSTGSGLNSWDAIRYSTSEDGFVWTPPQVVLAVSGGVNERAACDPSVVRFNRGDGEKYYLFYSGNISGYETVMFVARADNLSGPYRKYTSRGTWELNPSDPKVILYPKSQLPAESGKYGAGEQTVVAHNGRLYSWYMDDTEGYPGGTEQRIYFSSTVDPISWPSGQRTNVSSVSVDVKYDHDLGLFSMYAIEPHHGEESHLVTRRSNDGINWWASSVPCASSCFPDFAHNVGVSGNAQGYLVDKAALVAYGAPYDLDPACGACWAQWDLYAHYITTNHAETILPLIFNVLN